MDTFESLSNNIRSGKWSPFYLFMGEEPYYVDKLCNLIIDNALQPFERDFNQTILYGSDTSVSEIVSLCSRFPMMAERQLVIVKEAQLLKKFEDFNLYLDHLIDTTILVLCFIGKNADKRTSFYKNALSKGVVFESSKVKEDAIPKWIDTYVKEHNKKITQDAALLLSEYAGNQLRKLVLEIDKLINSTSQEQETITALDIEKNIGISREFNATELAKALSSKDAVKSYQIAYYLVEHSQKDQLQMTLGFLFYHFSKLELIQSIIRANPKMQMKEVFSTAGVSYYYSAPYYSALNNYTLFKTMKIISLIRECDYKSKSNAGGFASRGELLTDLVSGILTL